MNQEKSEFEVLMDQFIEALEKGDMDSLLNATDEISDLSDEFPEYTSVLEEVFLREENKVVRDILSVLLEGRGIKEVEEYIAQNDDLSSYTFENVLEDIEYICKTKELDGPVFDILDEVLDEHPEYIDKLKTMFLEEKDEFRKNKQSE